MATQMQLSDDGTLDTVISCAKCGAEFRYNFDGEGEPQEADTESSAYDRFVEWALEDAAEEHDCDRFDFAVDTALSWDGAFPPVGKGDYIVTIGSIDTEEVKVLVSRRYTSAVDAKQAAEIALGAFAERHDYETDDDGNVAAVTNEMGTGIPCWVVSTEEVK